MKTALVIDDEGVFRTLIAEILRSDGWEVGEAEDGETGVNMAAEHPPDVVICDLLMPRCNGFQVCRAIRRQRELQHTKIVVTSGRAYAADRLNALEAGAHEYLVKPVHAAELLSLINKLVGDETAAPPPLPPASVPDEQPAQVKFWGVRGSIPTPGQGTVIFGGNTSCVEVRAHGEIIILDAGTGIRPLGLALAEEFRDRAIHLTLLISHTHWDHIQGFPFFAPAYNPKNRLRILGFEGARQGLETILSSQMETPYFPIGLRQMPGNIAIEELKDLQFKIGKLPVQAHFMNHPGICVGYRLFTSSGSIAYLPDNEPCQRLRAETEILSRNATAALQYARMQDEKLVEFIHEAELVIMDTQYDAQEYQAHVGWGHGCLDDVVDLALRAKVKHLFLFHHDPQHDDEKISSMVARARDLAADRNGDLLIDAAQEGVELVLRPKAQSPVERAS